MRNQKLLWTCVLGLACIWFVHARTDASAPVEDIGTTETITIRHSAIDAGIGDAAVPAVLMTAIEPEPAKSDCIATGKCVSGKLAASRPLRRRDPARQWERTREQGVLLARMFVSEDSSTLRQKENGGTEGELTLDHRMIAQTIFINRRSKRDFDGWVGVMAFLSPHVARLRHPKRHRQEWVSGLKATGESPPGAWVDASSVAEDERNDGDWHGVHGPNWVRLRDATIELWTELDFIQIENRIHMRPRTWGNVKDIISYLKRSPGMCVLDLDTKNFFVARPGEGCQLGDPATVAARTGHKPGETE